MIVFKLLVTSAIFFALIPGHAMASSVDYSLDIETAFNLESDASSKNQITFEPEFTHAVGSADLVSILRFRHEFENMLEPGQHRQSSRSSLTKRNLINSHSAFELRELYLDYYKDDMFIRIGKQQMVWGEADGIKLLDVLNPQSFREFILADFNDSRIPLWSVNINKSINDQLNTQFIYIPDTTYHEIPERGSAFEFSSPVLVPNVPNNQNILTFESKKPADVVFDGDYGARIYGFSNGWEFSLNYIYHYLDTPKISVQESLLGLHVISTYQRNHTIGGSFNFAIGDWVVRGESAYKTNQFHYFEDSNGKVGSFDSGELSLLIGVDFQGINDTFVSSQLYASRINHYQQQIIKDEVDYQLTFLLERKYLNENLIAKILFINSLNTGDGLVQSEVKYLESDSLTLTMGLDIFHGNDKGLYGQFDQNDRITFGLNYSF